VNEFSNAGWSVIAVARSPRPRSAGAEPPLGVFVVEGVDAPPHLIHGLGRERNRDLPALAPFRIAHFHRWWQFPGNRHHQVCHHTQLPGAETPPGLAPGAKPTPRTGSRVLLIDERCSPISRYL
jgi:hypothetical protein